MWAFARQTDLILSLSKDEPSSDSLDFHVRSVKVWAP